VGSAGGRPEVFDGGVELDERVTVAEAAGLGTHQPPVIGKADHGAVLYGGQRGQRTDAEGVEHLAGRFAAGKDQVRCRGTCCRIGYQLCEVPHDPAGLLRIDEVGADSQRCRLACRQELLRFREP
jgi:hypothetical protein